MPKVGKLGVSMLRGNTNNFYIRDDDDLDDIDTSSVRGPAEYPHIHVVTTGSHWSDEITYIGITFGGSQSAIDIFRSSAHLCTLSETEQYIITHCPGISRARVPNLARYLHGYSIQVFHQ